MWIAKKSNWHVSTTSLQKFAIERIIQRCDFAESISNKHRTLNGYTQLKELIHYCNLTLKRSKAVKTLMVILEEAKSPFVRQNIVSDVIIERYFVDLKVFISKYDQTKLVVEKGQPNLVVLENLAHKLKIFEKQLDLHYFQALKDELMKINYSEDTQVHRNAALISDLIDLLIPYLLFAGYSLATISEILRFWIRYRYLITINKFFKFIGFEKRGFSFLQYLGVDSPEVQDFLGLLRTELDVEVTEVEVLKLEKDFLEKHNITGDGIFAKYTYNTLDPHKHVSANYDVLMKKLVVKRERQSLFVFNDFFAQSFWSDKPNKPNHKYKKIALEGDPINVEVRSRTLRETLIKSSKAYGYSFEEDNHIPNVKLRKLENALYYYNLALGSKSIENSLSLLWTSLESIHPYKIYTSDIEAIQKFLSIGLSIGSLSRDISAFALRLVQVNKQHDHSLNHIGTLGFEQIESTKGLKEWFNWMRKPSAAEANFELLRENSELLAYQYLSIARPLVKGKQSIISKRIESSEHSIKYQLQRIYMHRNKIVHSGDMINEYTNLWMHLEWYVGKILAYFIIQLHFRGSCNSLEEAFMELEADQQYLFSYLKKNEDKKISELPERIVDMLFKHSWQSF